MYGVSPHGRSGLKLRAWRCLAQAWTRSVEASVAVSTAIVYDDLPCRRIVMAESHAFADFSRCRGIINRSDDCICHSRMLQNKTALIDLV